MPGRKTDTWITLVASVRSSGIDSRALRTGWSPRADVYESPQGVVVSIELAGVHSSQVSVQYDPNREGLVVRGVRTVSHSAGLVACQIEIEDGPFERFIPLPTTDLDLDHTESKWQTGILILSIPKALTGPQGFVVESLTRRSRG